jgi:hypothetical protein
VRLLGSARESRPKVKLSTLGFLLTTVAVAALVGSMVVGLRGTPPTESISTYSSPTIAGRDDRIRVEVLNGAGINGLARQVTERLRDEGFDVVYYGNASAPQDSTTILDRLGKVEEVRSVGTALGVDRIVTAIDTTLYLEATVILGRDWPTLEP